MTLGRLAALVLGVLMVAVGVLWTGQGLGWFGGSSMSGRSEWAVIGPLMGGLGVALVIVVVQRIRAPRSEGPMRDRYGR